MIVGDAIYYAPAADELVIKNKAVAINPADNHLQSAGMLLEEYPAIIGCDVAGVVEEVGTDLAGSFKQGDRVIAMTGPLKHYKHAAFQEYVVVKAPMLAKMPDGLAFTDAVVLPLGLTTATSCLFGDTMLDLALPPTDAGHGKTLIVWGASSSVGCGGLQLAVAAGYEVFAIASSRNHDFLKSIGAAHCFDYNSETLISDVVKRGTGKDIVGAMDAISTDETLSTLCDILDQSGARKFIASIMPGADGKGRLGITIRPNFGNDIYGNGVGYKVWHDFVEPALADGTLHCKPDPEIVGNGLQEVQKAVNLLAQGVSAKKLVVTI